jgi:RNA polymerase sigma-70 factor (ECF subfamily)
MNSTSVSLLRRLRKPNQDAAWQRFVDLYAPLIFFWGRGQGLSATDSADLVQEVMAILVVKLPQFEYDPKRRFRGWLRTVTINKAKDLHRQNTARPSSGHDEAIQSVTVANNVNLFDEAEYRNFLANRALELMKAEFRDQSWQACWKHVVEGTKAAEVARELGISVNMVYLAKSRVLTRLREELDGLLD